MTALASPALAQSPLTFWVDIYHGQWPDSPQKVKTYQFELGSMDKVNNLCHSPRNLMRTVQHMQRTDLYLQTKYVSAAICVTDKLGNIKIAAGTLPVGSY